MRSKNLAIVALVAGFALSNVQTADAVIYAIGWTGDGGYTLEGQLTFDDSLLGTGVIDETKIDDLFIEVFLNGASQGTAAMASFDGNVFNLNFDTNAEQFAVGGLAGGPQGQAWNFFGSTVGFGSGSFSQLVTLNGSEVDASQVLTPSTLTATRVKTVTTVTTVIPLPATALLLLTGLGALGLARRRAA